MRTVVVLVVDTSLTRPSTGTVPLYPLTPTLSPLCHHGRATETSRSARGSRGLGHLDRRDLGGGIHVQVVGPSDEDLSGFGKPRWRFLHTRTVPDLTKHGVLRNVARSVVSLF